MRTINLTGGTASIPDSIVYAFNPNYVEINLSGQSGVVKLRVSDGSKDYEIDATLYNGKAKCYVSRLLQLLFDDYVNTRSKSVTITVTDAEGASLGSGTCTVLWAALEAGMTYGYYLPIATDVNWAGKALREVVWFKNFPQKISYLNDGAIVDAELSQFSREGIKVIPCNDKDGTYLRWIDNYGFWQYFLFDSGKRKSKNKLGSTAIDAEYSVSGVRHQARRYTHVENTDTVTCCAVSLRKEILAYVETIYKSPHIDFYVGNNVWKPVTIASGTVQIDADKKLYDYEISFTMPENQVQTI